MGCAKFVCRGWEGSLLSFSPWMRILRLCVCVTEGGGETLTDFDGAGWWILGQA